VTDEGKVHQLQNLYCTPHTDYMNMDDTGNMNTT